MAPDAARPGTAGTPTRDAGSNTAVNALIGAVAGIVLSFVPFSPLLGGIVAGYLEGGELRDGLVVGVIAGLVMFVPFILLGLFVAMVLLGLGNGAPALVFGVLLFFILFVAAVYTVALSAVGGLLGVYVEHEL